MIDPVLTALTRLEGKVDDTHDNVLLLKGEVARVEQKVDLHAASSTGTMAAIKTEVDGLQSKASELRTDQAVTKTKVGFLGLGGGIGGAGLVQLIKALLAGNSNTG